MGLANAPMASAVFSWSLRFLRKIEANLGKLEKIADYEFKMCGIFLKSPRFPAPGTFLGNRLKVGIYTGACAKSPFELGSINWESGIGIGGILVIINGNIVVFFSLDVNERISPWLKGPKSPHRLISFFELQGTYVGIRLCAPSRLGGNDLTWLEIPSVTDNLGNDFILRKLYTSSMPTSWILQEMAAHSLTTNTAIVSKHTKGVSGKWSIWRVN